MNWIDVKDSVPDSPTRKVIVWVKGEYWPHYMHVGVFKDGKWNVDDYRVDGIVGRVSHWMPLPAPPEQNNTEKD